MLPAQSEVLSSPSVLGVVPVLVGPLQVLIAILPAVLLAVAGVALSLLKPRALRAGARLLWRLKLQAAAALLCAAGLVWAARALWPDGGGGAAGGAGAGEAGAGNWATFRGGLARRGVVPGSAEPAAGGIHWAWRRGREAFFSSPAVSGNRVYVAAAGLSVFRRDGAIYCFDAGSGAVVWRAAPEDYEPTFSSPVVAGDRLVCGEGLHDTDNARVVCIDLRPGHEGAILWTFRTRSHVECTPAVWEGRVYVGAGDDGIYCLALEPDAGGNARVLWHAPGEKYPDAETALAVGDGRVYAGLGVGGAALCVLDAMTGAEIRRLPTPYPVFGPPAIDGAKLYAGMGNGDFVHEAEELGLAPAGEVWCLDLANLEVDWRFRAGRTVLGAVAVAGADLYFGSRDGCLYWLGRDGKLRGKWEARAPIVASPAVGERYVYIVTAAGRLHALDRRGLEPVWELGVATQPACLSSPAVARGRVYVGTQADGFICAGVPAAEQAPLWSGPLGGPGKGGNLDGSPLPEAGALSWHQTFSPAGDAGAASVLAPVAALGGMIIVPITATQDAGIVCLDVPADSRRTSAVRWRHRTANGVSLSPAVAGGAVLVVDGGVGDAGRSLHALDAAGGTLRWKFAVDRNASGAFLATAEEILIASEPGALRALDLAGAPRWSAPTGELEREAAAADAMVIAAARRPAALIALDRLTGRELWRAALDAEPRGPPIPGRDTVYIGTAAGLEARSLLDGGLLAGWTRAGGAVASDIALGREQLAFVNASAELVVVSRAGGGVLHRLAGALPGVAPLLGRDLFLYATPDALMKLVLTEEDAEPEAWMPLEAAGAPSGPMVLSDSALYFGAAGRGLARVGARP